MKIFQKNYCEIGIGDTLYIVHDNDILEELMVTENHINVSSTVKPIKEVFNDLYLASDYYELTDDGRLKLNTLQYVYPEHSDIPCLVKGIKLGNVFIDIEKASKFLENKELNKKIHEQFRKYPRIWIYDKQTEKILDYAPTFRSTVIECILELDNMINEYKSKGFDVDIAVSDNKTYELIKDFEFINNIRKLLL